MFDSNDNANNVLPIHQSNNNNNHPFDDHLLNNFFPCQLLDDELFLNTILPYHPSAPPPLLLPPPPPPEVNETAKRKVPRKGMTNTTRDGGGSSKRKAGKKDRHTKIFTARGPRDRRMRLSLQIARKFFDLQDMLGFDKASKTIEWLFNKSRAAIKDLSEKSCTNGTDTNAIISPFLEQANGGCSDDGNTKEKLVCGRMNTLNSNNRRGIMCKMNEKRKQARARARERTKEKLMKNKECLEMEENPNNRTVDEDDNNDIVIRVDKLHQLEDQMASVGIIDNFLATSSSSMANNNFMDFPGNRSAENGSVNVGLLMQELAVENSEYTIQLQGPNCAFMGRTYNQGF